MKAWNLYAIGDIRFEEKEQPTLAEDEVLVRVHAAGICGSDIPRIFQDGAHRMPLVPGHEFSGEVVESGGFAGRQWVGKRAGIFPLIPCRACVACQKGRYEMCRRYSYLGSRQDGGFAEYVRVPVANLIELPEEVSYEQAAMLEPMAVAVHAIGRIQPAEEDSVVVFGLGTIGMLLVMFLLERGIEKLYVVGNKDFQKKTVLSLGVKESCYCDSRTEDVREWILEKTNGIGADAIFECIGKADTIALTVGLAAPAGKACMVGNPHSDVSLPRDIYWKILRNQLLITGSWNSSFILNGSDGRLVRGEHSSDWRYVVELLRKGRIHPEQLITQQLLLPELDKGLGIMRDKLEDYIKVMVQMAE